MYAGFNTNFIHRPTCTGSKTTMAEKPVYGGHDYEFVQEVSNRLNCHICTKVLRDPHLAVCCGQHFCESCLNKWFTRQGKESCPHCRAEGETFNHVIHKGLRSEINELKIKCGNHGEGCLWIGELGALKKHLESDNGCGCVMVECPNKCINPFGHIKVMKRKDTRQHLTRFCYLRPYQCKFCGLKDTYKAITGDNYSIEDIRGRLNLIEDGYSSGHLADCPEAPLKCPNKCGSSMIKRRDMKSHLSQCPQERVECPFAEAGCKIYIRRHQFEDHMTTSLQQHLMLLTIDYKQLKKEFYEVKAKLSQAETELDETKYKVYMVEAQLMFGEDFSNSANKLKNKGDSVNLIMPNFSEYRRSGKVWRSPPFYYREGYKMCLAVYANGVGNGAGTHVSVAILLLRGEYDEILKWPMRSCDVLHRSALSPSYEGHYESLVCNPLHRPQVDECRQIECCNQFCSLNGRALHLENDCLTFNVNYNDCILIVRI